MKKIKNEYIIIGTIGLLFVIGFILFFSNIEIEFVDNRDKNINSNIDKDPNENKTHEQQNETPKTTYKIYADEYLDYIKIISDDLVKSNKKIVSLDLRKHYPYLNIGLFLDKDYKDNELISISDEIFKYYYETLKQNNYKSSLIKYNYDLIEVAIYNKNAIYNVPSKFLQIDILSINKYKSFDELLKNSNQG